MYRYRNIIAWLICTFICINVSAQHYSPFNKIEGPISDVIHCIYQDSKGYIWVGTEDGVSRYDGDRFQHYTLEDGLSDNEVFQIHEDRKGRLWFVTFNGEPSIYDNGEILTSKNCSFLKNVTPGVMGVAFNEHGDSILYTSSYKAYLFVQDSLVKTIKSKELFMRNNVMFHQLYIYNAPLALIGNSGIYYVGSARLIPKKSLPKSKNLITKYVLNGTKLVYYTKDKLVAYDLANRTAEVIPIQMQGSIGRVQYRLAEEAYYILVENKIFRYKEDEGLTVISEHNIPFSVYGLFQPGKFIWLSSLLKGLYLSSVTNVHVLDCVTSLNTNASYCIKAYKGKVYAGFNNNEYMVWDGRDYKMKSSGSRPIVTKMYGFYELDDRLIGITGDMLIDVEHDYFSRYFHKISVKSIVANSKYLYVSTSRTINKFLKSEMENIERFGYAKYGAPLIYRQRANCMYLEGEDSLYLGCLDGLKLIVNDKEVSYPNDDKDIFNSYVSKIINDNEGRIVFSTNAKGIGLIYGDSYHVIDKAKGLSSNLCNSVYAENDSTLWAATNNGVNRVKYKVDKGLLTCDVEYYTTVNGLPTNEINDVTLLNDTVWLATDNGVCFFKKDEMTSFMPPKTIIEKLTANNEVIDLGSKIKLHHTYNNISIDYVGLSYYPDNKISYRYKLEGIDNDWNYTTARHVEYPNMAPGRYTFLVSATNTYDTWNNDTESIEFIIERPFWQTGRFITLTTLVIAVIIVAGVNMRIRAIKRKHKLENKALQLLNENAEFERELAQLEQKALNLQMNPHFIFNALNTIKSFYAGNEKKQADNYIDKFAVLMRKVLESNQQEKIALREEINILEVYMELTGIRQDYSFDYKVEVAPGINTQSVRIPPMLLQPIIENAVLHGVIPKGKGGEIKIIFEKEGDMLVCTIQDNGIGRKQSEVVNKYKIRKSRGIEITRKRIFLLSEESTLTFTDLVDEHGQAMGTRVKIKIPLQYDTQYNS